MFQFPIDVDVTPLDSEFGLATGAHQTLPFEVLVKAQLARLRLAWGLGTGRLPVPGARGWWLGGASWSRVGLPTAIPNRAWGGGEGQNNADSLP